MKPLKKTPEAKMCTSLSKHNSVYQTSLSILAVHHLRSTRARQTRPKKNRQEYHEKGMRSQVRGKGKIRVKRRRPDSLLKPS